MHSFLTPKNECSAVFDLLLLQDASTVKYYTDCVRRSSIVGYHRPLFNAGFGG